MGILSISRLFKSIYKASSYKAVEGTSWWKIVEGQPWCDHLIMNLEMLGMGCLVYSIYTKVSQLLSAI